MILIDADILVDISRQYPPALKWVETASRDEIGVVGFAAMELINGCRDAAALRRAERLLTGFEIIWPGASDLDRTLRRFGERRLRLGLNAPDALIAETAIGRHEALYTFNTRHFAAYPELQTIQPYTKA